MPFDLLVRGGIMVDPGTQCHEAFDIGIADGRIAAIEKNLGGDAARVLDVEGQIVTPGLIDCHVHSYAGVSHVSFDADDFCTAGGVTTAIDAGSSGMINFAGFRRFIAATSRTRMLAFVHIATYGVMRDPGELVDLTFADVDGTAATIRANRDVAVGVKVRVADHHVADNGPQAMALAVQAGEASASPVMVHIGHTRMSIEEVVGALRPGDIVTHCFTPLEPTLLNDDGQIRDAVLAAQRRGVLFDVGPCDVDFDMAIARVCMAGGLPPDLISTDAYANRFPRPSQPAAEPVSDRLYTLEGSAGHVRVDNLPKVLSIFMALGMSLDEVIACCTTKVAKAIGWDDRLGRLAVGREADISVLELVEAPVTLQDSLGSRVAADRSLQARWTIRAGVAYPAG